MTEPPESYFVGEELNWDAPWVDVRLRVELPFWLMVDNTTLPIDVGGHTFAVSIHGETFELHGREISDSKRNVIYQGPPKEIAALSPEIQEFLREHPDFNVLWRKCKTVLKIPTRCNEDVWNKAQEDEDRAVAAVNLYLEELCRAHIPVVNRLIQGYRLATYDYFAFEVASWDVPIWHVEREGESVSCILVPYQAWDHRPLVTARAGGQPSFYQLIEAERLRLSFLQEATPGESELLDALNLVERGDLSGAVRRVTTAIEVVVEAVLESALVKMAGEAAAKKFIKDTRNAFDRRVAKYESGSGRSLPEALRAELDRTRKLRHEIVHKGYRLNSAERGSAAKAVDTGRWIFNWFENDEARRAVRERRIAFRSLGRDLMSGIFGGQITPDGVVLTNLLGADHSKSG